jgi:capsular polysaccharide biosynthesis protein
MKVVGDVHIDPLNDAGSSDLVRHFRQLMKVAAPALLIALLVGGITLVVITRAKPVYKAVVTAEIDAQTPVVNGDAYLYQMTAPYLALATSDPIRQSIATKMGSGWDADKVKANVAVAVSKSPLLLEVSATAPDRAQAIKLATSTVVALDEGSTAQRHQELDRAVAAATVELQHIAQQLTDMNSSEPANSPKPTGNTDFTSSTDPAKAALEAQFKDLQQQIDRIRSGGVNGLSVLSVPSESDIPQTAATSKSVALFAGLVALIVAAECLVLVRGRFGRRLTFASAERIARANELGIEVLNSPTDEMPPVTQGMIARCASTGSATLILTTSRAEAIAKPWLKNQKAPELIIIEPVSSNWAARLDGAIGLAILLACRSEEVRNQIEQAAKTLTSLGIPSRLVLTSLPATAQHRESLPATAQDRECPAISTQLISREAAVDSGL